MVDVVGGGEDLGLIDVVDVDGLEHLSLHKVANAALGHHGDGDRRLDALDHVGVAHTAHTACGADVGGDALERHDGAGAGLLGNACLLRCRNVHNDAAFEHLRELAVELGALRSGRWRDGLLIPLILCHVWSSLRWRVCVAT